MAHFLLRMALRLQATQHLLHTYDDEGNNRDGEDNVGDEPVAVLGCLLVRHLADSAHTVCEEMGPTVPGPEHGSGRDGPEADEECPTCQETESVLHGVYQRQEALLIANGRACTEEQLRPDDQHRHHEQGG